jgi:glucose 1-dehydrogenase
VSSLSGKSIVVTGGNSGIGKAIVLAAAAAGADVVVDYNMHPELLEQLNAAIPLGRIAQAAEIADMVVFLASDKAGYVNATTITVDSGLSQWGVGL